MDLERLAAAWRAQQTEERVISPTEALMQVVQASRRMERSILWRDVRETLAAAAVAIAFAWTGYRSGHYVWPWYAAAACMLWIPAFLVVDRRVHRDDKAGETIEAGLARALRQVNHQIALLRNVVWWYLLPCSLAVLLVGGEMAVRHAREAGGLVWLSFAASLAVVGIVYGFVYRLNQAAVRANLLPLGTELEKALEELRSAE